MTDNKPKDVKKDYGVYYDSKSYAGFWLRVFSWAVDLILLSIIVILYSLIYFNSQNSSMLAFNIYFWGSFFTCHLYLTLVKTSNSSTLGFWLAKIKVVDLYGKKPSFLTMTFRFLLLAIGPFGLITDLLWITSEETKQTLRDKFMGTFVVKKAAEPIGKGLIQHVRLFIFRWNLIIKEVSIPQKSLNKDT